MVVAVAIAVVVTLPAWGGRSIAGKDVMFQLVRADFGLSHLLFHGRLDGWFPRFFLGHQEFLVYGPGLTWTVGVVRVLTLGTLSTAGAMKVVSLASFAGFPLAVAFVARSYGLRRNAAGFAALLSLLVSTPYGLGLQGLFQSGLIAHQVGAIFWALALGSFLRIPRDRRARWIVLGAASLGALALTHDISLGTLAIVYATSIACLALPSRISWSGVQRVAGAAALGAALIGFWVIPFLAHRDLQGNFTTWATPNLGTRLHDIIAGGVLFPPFVGIVVVAAWLWGWRGLRTGGPYALAVLVAPAVFLVTSHTLVALWPHNIVIAQLANRGSRIRRCARHVPAGATPRRRHGPLHRARAQRGARHRRRGRRRRRARRARAEPVVRYSRADRRPQAPDPRRRRVSSPASCPTAPGSRSTTTTSASTSTSRPRLTASV